MTTQNREVKGPKISVNYGSSTPSLSPATKLIDFLNVNSTDINEVKNVCQKYKIISPGDIKNWYKNFVEQQKKLKEIVVKAIENKLEDSDLAEINKNLESIHPYVRFMNDQELMKVNKVMSAIEGQLEKRNKQYLVITNKHLNPLVSLWKDFVDYLISLQPLKVCGNCGQFFTPSERTGNKQKFCSELCRDSYHKRKKYHESKNLNK
jgi:hypothetical protein